MRLLLNTAMVAGLLTGLAARADTYPALDRTAAHPQLEATALAQDDAAVPLGRSDPPPLARAVSFSFATNSAPLQPLHYNRFIPSTTVLSLGDGSTLLGVNLPTSSLAEYAGSSICSMTANCSADMGAAEQTAAEVEPGGLESLVSAIAPEPPSMLLIATGLLSLAGVVRRRTHARRTNTAPDRPPPSPENRDLL